MFMFSRVVFFFFFLPRLISQESLTWEWTKSILILKSTEEEGWKKLPECSQEEHAERPTWERSRRTETQARGTNGNWAVSVLFSSINLRLVFVLRIVWKFLSRLSFSRLHEAFWTNFPYQKKPSVCVISGSSIFLEDEIHWGTLPVNCFVI